MNWFDQLKKLFGLSVKPDAVMTKPAEKTLYENKSEELEIHSLWDYIKIQDNTQAQHIVNVIGFDEWVTMEEIQRRIQEIFGISYQNERSLYPYIKTLVDCGLLEISNVGGKRKWRKKDLLIKLKKVQEEEIESSTAEAKVSMSRKSS